MLATAVALAIATSWGFRPVAATAAEVLAAREKFDGQAVRVVGKVSKYQAKTSRRGNPYTVFTIEAGGAKLSVYHQEHQAPAPKDGDTVEVTGVYEKERKVGSFTVKDQVDATPGLGRTLGVRKV